MGSIDEKLVRPLVDELKKGKLLKSVGKMPVSAKKGKAD